MDGRPQTAEDREQMADGRRRWWVAAGGPSLRPCFCRRILSDYGLGPSSYPDRDLGDGSHPRHQRRRAGKAGTSVFQPADGANDFQHGGEVDVHPAYLERGRPRVGQLARLSCQSVDIGLDLLRFIEDLLRV